MSRLGFEVVLESVPVHTLPDLPVQVRNARLVPVAVSTTSQTVELKPGTYNVTATLPGGQELFAEVKVPAGRDTVVTLTVDPDDYSPHEWLAREHFLGSLPRDYYAYDAGKDLEMHRPAAHARLRAFSGNLLKHEAVETTPWDPSPPQGQVVKLELPGSNAVRLIQLLQPNEPALNVALPVSSMEGCQVILTRRPDGGVALDIDLENVTAEALLRYYANGQLANAALISSSPAGMSEKLLFGKVGQPIAATVGAYMLLRLGQLERLHNWTENLKNWFAWLPDGLAIRAEHLARQGEHASALKLLLELPTRGLPLFSDGLSYAIDRLRFLLSLSRNKVVGPEQEQARTLLEQLQRFASFVDFQQPILTFTGLDPRSPEAKPLGADLAAYGGLDLTAVLI